ncbi:Zinc uptake regulation protein [bioreactor metagenome]|uniref:FUR family transcriptional regulator n=3 Tax=root TaxID=1 RepID=A0AB33HTH1_9CHLR|nr:FUR family transcriptional regulator [Dehalococcoides mccartyi]
MLVIMQLDNSAMSCINILKNAGYKLTLQRKLVVDVIHSYPSHLTAEEIISKVQEKFPDINRSTVYRTLELLENTGCVVKSKMDDRTIYHHADEGHHHHLVCSRCGRRIECSDDMLSSLREDIQSKYGFNPNLSHMVINGLCADCRK